MCLTLPVVFQGEAAGATRGNDGQQPRSLRPTIKARAGESSRPQDDNNTHKHDRRVGGNMLKDQRHGAAMLFVTEAQLTDAQYHLIYLNDRISHDFLHRISVGRVCSASTLVRPDRGRNSSSLGTPWLPCPPLRYRHDSQTAALPWCFNRLSNGLWNPLQ